jgi:allantoinase
MKGLETGRFDTAWGGIASLSLGASILATALGSAGLEAETPASDELLVRLARLMSLNPARLAGLFDGKGQIAEGFDADLFVFAPEESFTVTRDDLYFRHPISPYVGERLTGRVQQTILRGQLVFDHGRFPGGPVGREARP